MRRLLILLCLIPLTAWAAPVKETQISFSTLSKGVYSGLTQPTQQIIRSEKIWLGVWAQLQSHLVPIPPAPKVNFSKNTVVVVSLGQQSSGGHDIEVESVVLKGKVIEIGLAIQHPGPGCLTTQALTQPYHVISVPRRFTEAKFVEHIKAKPCGERR